MKSYKLQKRKLRRWPRLFIIIGIIIVLAIPAAIIGARRIYSENLKAVDINSQADVVVAIPSGSSLDQIAKTLKSKKLIRSELAFKRYVGGKELSDLLKAGTYRFKASQDVAGIVDELVAGKVDVSLFTIFPALRIDLIKQEFIDKGFAENAVNSALNPGAYAGHPALVDKPAGASLEGYLYPDSFQRTAETTPEDIVRSSLNEMAKVLTPDIRAGIAKQGLNVHQGIILASIIEKEIPSNPSVASEDRKKAAQVFLKRYKTGMMLGSDVTALYGAELSGVKITDANRDQYILFESPYNTRLHTGLPPGPISNVSKSSLGAVAAPADTDYLYFVAGKDCVTRFSSSQAEHESLVSKYGLSTDSTDCR